MKLTNKANLPEAIVKAIRNDGYTKGGADFSVTELLKPPRQRALTIKHKDEITEDVQDRLWALYGQVAHGILERANMNDLSEVRFFGDFDGVTVSGQIDTLAIVDGVLSDFKFTTSWSFKSNQAAKPEWTAQLNMQLELLRMNGKDAKSLQIIGLLRDWSQGQAKKDPNYPQCPIMILPIEVWPREKTQSFIRERIKAHKDAEKNLPLCSKEERWAQDDVWAVMKKGRKTAVKLYGSEIEARAHAESDSSLYVVFRPGKSNRCEGYCSAAPFCDQYKQETQNQSEEIA